MLRGLNGSILDFSFAMFSNLDDVTHQFANYCLAAYETDPKYCPLAGPSSNSHDPVTDIVNRINTAIDYLSKTTDPRNDETWSFIRLTSFLSSNVGDPLEVWNWAQGYLDLETAIQNLGTSSRIKRQVSSGSQLSFASLEDTDLSLFLVGSQVLL